MKLTLILFLIHLLTIFIVNKVYTYQETNLKLINTLDIKEETFNSLTKKYKYRYAIYNIFTNLTVLITGFSFIGLAAYNTYFTKISEINGLMVLTIIILVITSCFNIFVFLDFIINIKAVLQPYINKQKDKTRLKLLNEANLIEKSVSNNENSRN